MSITRRVKTPVKRRSKYSAAEIGRADHRQKPMKMMTIRLPADLDAMIDQAIRKRMERVSKNSFLIDAAHKLCRAELGA